MHGDQISDEINNDFSNTISLPNKPWDCVTDYMLIAIATDVTVTSKKDSKDFFATSTKLTNKFTDILIQILTDNDYFNITVYQHHASRELHSPQIP